jgi:hypothetical protein
MAKKSSSIVKKSKAKTKSAAKKTGGKKKVKGSKAKSKRSQHGGEKENKQRSFKVIFNGVETGRFMARMPRQAASKALTSLKKYNNDFEEDSQNVFYLKETTRGCNRRGKLFKYEGEIKELDEPKVVELSGREVVYTHENKIHSLGKCERSEVYGEESEDEEESEDPELIDSDDNEISDIDEDSGSASEEKVVKKGKRTGKKKKATKNIRKSTDKKGKKKKVKRAKT